MRRTYLSLWTDAVLLGMEAQWVIGLRMMRLLSGGAAAEAEMTRLVSEKAVAAAAAATDAAAAAALGKSNVAIAHKTIRGYRKRVRANRRRLTPR